MSPAEDAAVPLAGDVADLVPASEAPAEACGEAPVLLVALASLVDEPQPAVTKASAMIEVVIVRYVMACDSLRLIT
jgi:hypothetical protein